MGPKSRGKAKHHVPNDLTSLAQNRRQPRKVSPKPAPKPPRKYQQSIFDGEAPSEEEYQPDNILLRVSPRKRKNNFSEKPTTQIPEPESDSDLDDAKGKRKRQRAHGRASNSAPTRTSPRVGTKRTRDEPKRSRKGDDKARTKLEAPVLPARSSSRIKARRERNLVASHAVQSDDSNESEKLDGDLDSGSDDFELPLTVRKAKKSFKSRSQPSIGVSRRSQRIQKSSKFPAYEKRVAKSAKSKKAKSSSKHADSDSESTNDLGDAEDDVCGTQESNASEPLLLSIKAIPTRKRRRPSEGKLAEYQYMRKRLSEEELSILRVAFIKWYPTPPSNLQAQSRFEQQYGREMSKKMIDGLWKLELGPWSERWWKFFQDFFDLAREKKKEKPQNRDPTITKAEAAAWSKEFHDKHGDAKPPVDFSKIKKPAGASPSNTSEEQRSGTSNSGKAQSASSSGNSKPRSADLTNSMPTRSSSRIKGAKAKSTGISKIFKFQRSNKLASESVKVDEAKVPRTHRKGGGQPKVSQSAAMVNETVASLSGLEVSPAPDSQVFAKSDFLLGETSNEFKKPIADGNSGPGKRGLRKLENLNGIPTSASKKVTAIVRSGSVAVEKPNPDVSPLRKAAAVSAELTPVPLKLALRRASKSMSNASGVSPDLKLSESIPQAASRATSTVSDVPPVRSAPFPGPNATSLSGNVPSLRSAPQLIANAPSVPSLRSVSHCELPKIAGKLHTRPVLTRGVSQSESDICIPPTLRDVLEPQTSGPDLPPLSSRPQAVSTGLAPLSVNVAQPLSAVVAPPPLRGVTEPVRKDNNLLLANSASQLVLKASGSNASTFASVPEPVSELPGPASPALSNAPQPKLSPTCTDRNTISEASSAPFAHTADGIDGAAKVFFASASRHETLKSTEQARSDSSAHCAHE